MDETKKSKKNGRRLRRITRQLREEAPCSYTIYCDEFEEAADHSLRKKNEETFETGVSSLVKQFGCSSEDAEMMMAAAIESGFVRSYMIAADSSDGDELFDYIFFLYDVMGTGIKDILKTASKTQKRAVAHLIADRCSLGALVAIELGAMTLMENVAVAMSNPAMSIEDIAFATSEYMLTGKDRFTKQYLAGGTLDVEQIVEDEYYDMLCDDDDYEDDDDDDKDECDMDCENCSRPCIEDPASIFAVLDSEDDEDVDDDDYEDDEDVDDDDDEKFDEIIECDGECEGCDRECECSDPYVDGAEFCFRLLDVKRPKSLLDEIAEEMSKSWDAILKKHGIRSREQIEKGSTVTKNGAEEATPSSDTDKGKASEETAEHEELEL